MKKLTGNRIFLLGGAAVLIAFISQLQKIPAQAKTYPLVLIILGFVTTFLLFIMPQRDEEAIGKDNAMRLVVFGAMIALSLLLLTKIGYILATLLFMYTGLWYLGMKKGLAFILFPLILTMAMYFLFTIGLSVILPVGSWISLTL